MAPATKGVRATSTTISNEQAFEGCSDASDSTRPIARVTSRPQKSRQHDEPPQKKRRVSDDKSHEGTLPRVAPKVAERLAQDNEEIIKLERKLGLKSKKLPQAFSDAGLSELIGDLDQADAQNGKPKDEDWLQSKRSGPHVSDDEVASEVTIEDADSVLLNDESASDSGSESDDVRRVVKKEKQNSHTQHRRRENPFIPPVPSHDTKYVPPSRRAPPAGDGEARSRLRRQVQGSLNKLSESNMISIVTEVEKLYSSNPRQYVNDIIIELVLSFVSDPAALSTTVLLLYASFLTAFYRLSGTDFGARCIDRLVTRVDRLASASTQEISDKQVLNLTSLLAHLYSLELVNSAIVIDNVLEYLLSLTEDHTEIILRLIRCCGPKLRQDDPGAIKEITMRLQRQVASSADGDTSVRTRFMVEEIVKLRDNKLRSSTVNDVQEQVARFRKTLGALNSRSLKGNQPLNLGLRDIRDSDKRGKWWLVGARWAGKVDQTSSSGAVAQGQKGDLASTTDKKERDVTSAEIDLTMTAKAHGMNTTIRRSIFVTLMSSADARDAYSRLLKLNLTRTQERQIPSVLLHCVGVESQYNPYYGFVARQLCKSHKLRMAFHFALRDLVKRMESSEDEQMDTADQPLSLTSMVNYAKIYGDMISASAVPIVTLKSVDMRRAKGRVKMFVELLLLTIIKEAKSKGGMSADDTLMEAFGKAKEVDELCSGLRWFLKHVVMNTDLVQGKERDRVRRKSKMITNLLRNE